MASTYEILKKTADDDEFYFNIKGKIERGYMASLYEILKKTADDDEFYFNIKGKIEKLLNIIINSDVNLKDMINISLSYETDIKLVHNSIAHSKFVDGLNMNNEFYTDGIINDSFPWETWMYNNFKDYVTTLQIYKRFLKSNNVSEDDLILLNFIYAKYEM